MEEIKTSKTIEQSPQPSLELLKIINDLNKSYIDNLQKMPPIVFDGLACPKCLTFTVTCSGHTWCPSFNCDYGTDHGDNIAFSLQRKQYSIKDA